MYLHKKTCFFFFLAIADLHLKLILCSGYNGCVHVYALVWRPKLKAQCPPYYNPLKSVGVYAWSVISRFLNLCSL